MRDSKKVSEAARAVLAEAGPIFDQKLAELAADWASSAARPRPPNDICVAWASLLENWIDSEVPLVVRKSSYPRGSEHRHDSGRLLTFADNTTAHWVMEIALRGETPTLDKVRSLMANGDIPTFFALKSVEKATLIYGKPGFFGTTSLNAVWKVCHIEPVGLGQMKNILSIDIDLIHNHLRKFLSPSNMFLVPIGYGGLGETRAFCQAMRTKIAP